MKNYLVLLAFSLAGCNLKSKDNADLARNKLRQTDISATIDEIAPFELQYSSFGLSKVTAKVSNPNKHSVEITLSSLPLGLITTDSCRSNRETIWCVFNLQGSFSGFRVAVASVEDYSTGSVHQKSFTLTQSDIGYVQFGTDKSDFTDFSLIAASTSIKLDELNNIYAAGQTTGAYFLKRNFGKRDVFLSKYDEYGNQIWLKQFGTSGNDAINSIAIDQLGNIYVGGWTIGAFSGYVNAGADDLFLAKYDKDGNRL